IREKRPHRCRTFQRSESNTHERSRSLMMNTMMMNGGMGLMMLGMFLSTTLWLLLLAGLTWALITWLNRQLGKPAVQGELHTPKEPTAQEILLQRYAGS